jgi:hypothetical protein
VVAVGDRLLIGFGLALGGVSAESSVASIAWAAHDCLTLLAVNAASTAQVVQDQLPMLHGKFGTYRTQWSGGYADFRCVIEQSAPGRVWPRGCTKPAPLQANPQRAES